MNYRPMMASGRTAAPSPMHTTAKESRTPLAHNDTAKPSPGARVPGHGPRGTSVEFRNIRKNYGSVVAVEDASLSVAAGEFTTILGPSGSGKSTLLMLLAGFEDPTRGDILVDGRAINRVPPYRRNQGMVFQGYALFPHLTVAQNLAFPLTARGIVGARARDLVAKALERVRLGGMADRLPRELSGGQQQRVALARAIVFEPPVLLMDEPLSALDRNLREQMQFELKSLHEEIGNTVICVTHDQQEAITMSDKVAVMNRGRIVQIGAPRQVYDNPVNAFIASFLGETNFIAARVGAVHGEIAELALEGGRNVRAVAAGSAVRTGDAVRAFVRPESLVLAPRGADADGAADAGERSVIEGSVEKVIFLGDAFRYILRAAGMRLVAKATCSPEMRQFHKDDAVDIRIGHSDLKIIDD